MAQKRYRQGPWPPRTDDQPVNWTLAPDSYQRSDRRLVGPLRMGTQPPVGPKGRAVIADYERNPSDMGTDMIARDRRVERKYPSDLVAREIRGPGSTSRKDIESKGKRFPKDV